MYPSNVRFETVVPLFLVFFFQHGRGAEGLDLYRGETRVTRNPGVNVTTLPYGREHLGSLLKRADDEDPKDNQTPEEKGLAKQTQDNTGESVIPLPDPGLEGHFRKDRYSDPSMYYDRKQHLLVAPEGMSCPCSPLHEFSCLGLPLA